MVRALRRLGFTGPFSGTRYEFMVKGTLRLRIPNPHRGEIGGDLLARILREAGISRDEWQS
ncbi:MAG: type II toxin-antitoxin system HicA family toxin [Chloroflexi bacterium]|nr:type II toxin-antitoxin system HicA family toxin [Chloroflexota bacterium]